MHGWSRLLNLNRCLYIFAGLGFDLLFSTLLDLAIDQIAVFRVHNATIYWLPPRSRLSPRFRVLIEERTSIMPADKFL